MGIHMIVNRPLAAAAAGLFACALVLVAGPVQAATPKEVTAAILKLPAFANKKQKVQDTKAAGKHFTTKIGPKKTPADVFNTGTDKKPVWNVAISPKSLSLKKLFKKKGTEVLGDLALANVGLIIAGADAKNIKVTALPKAVQDRVKKVFGSKLKTIALKEGANFFATVNVAKSGILGLLKKHLGVKDRAAAMSGSVSNDVVDYVVTGRPGKEPDISAVNLYFALSGLKPRKVSKIFYTGNLVMNLRGTKTKAGDPTVQFTGSTSATVVINKKKLTLKTLLNLKRNPSPDPKKKDRYVDITGTASGKALGGLKIRDYQASLVKLNAGLTAQKALQFAVTGEAQDKKDKKKKITFAGKVDINQTSPKFSVVLTGDLTVKDVIGVSIPGLDGLKFKEAQFAKTHTSGKVNLNGDEMNAVAFKLGRLPVIAFLAKTFDMTQHLPGFDKTIFGQAVMSNAALIVVPKGGATTAPVPTKKLPVPIKAVTEAALGKGETLELKEGVNFAFKMDTRKDPALKRLYEFFGIKPGSLAFQGRVTLAMLKDAAKNQNQKPATVKQAQQKKANSKKLMNEFLSDLQFTAEFPAINLPLVRQLVQFKNPVFTVAGGPVMNELGRPTKDNELKITINGGMDLKFPGKTISMASQLGLTKGLEAKDALTVEVQSTSKIDWRKAFGIPFLTLNDIGLGGTIGKDKAKKEFVGLKIFSTVKLGAQTVKSSGEIVIAKAGPKPKKPATSKKKKKGFTLPVGIDDIVFRIEDQVDLAKLPGIGSIPGINEFAFKDIQLSPSYMAGDLTWKKKNITAQAAFLNNAGTFGLFFRMKNLAFNSLLPIPKPIGTIKFPAMVMALSTKKMTDVTYADLPPRVADLFDGIAVKDKKGNFVEEDTPVPVFDGVTMLTALDFKALPAQDPIRKVIEVELGIKEPLVIAGGVSGVFSGTPKLALYADLPGLVLPKNQPLSRVVSFNKVGAAFFLRADVAATVFQAGARGEMTISIPHIDDPRKVDKVTFNGELYASVDAVSAAGGVKVGGGMKGKWREPFGLKNFAFNDPAFVIGADSEGSVEFGAGGSVEFKARRGQTLNYAADFITNINFSSTIPLPKKLGLVLKGKKFGAIAQMEIADALFRGVVTGPMASEITKVLPDPVSRKAVQTLQAQLKKTSLLDIMQIDKIPLPLFEMQDVELFFATPGAIIPGREDTLDTIGMRVAGQANLVFMGRKDKLGKIDNRLTIKDGLKVFAEVPARNLGPIKLQRGVVDIRASIYELPHFKINGGTNIFGAKENLEIELSAKQALFAYDKDLGPLLKMNIVAKTVGEDLTRARDFIVSASTKTSIDTFLTKEVLPKFGIPEAISKLVTGLNPLFIDGGSFNGSLTQFVTGKPVVLKLDHKIFGRRVDPAVVELRPVWKDPLSAFPAIPIAKALEKSFLIDLAKNPVNMPAVNLGLIKVERAKLTALITDINDPKWVISGKTSFLGASRAVDVALSDKGYAFRVQDKIAGGLWDSDFRAWTVGGTALAPRDIKYWGRVDSDFEKWLKQELGKNLNKGFDTINAGYTAAANGLRAAENKVRSLDRVIEQKRAQARRDLNNLRRLLHQAKRHMDHTHWLMRKAQRSFDYYDRRYRSERRGAFWPWEWAKVGVLWGLRAGAWVAAKAAEGVYHAAQAAYRAIDGGLRNVPIDLHPAVAPIIVARTLAIGALQTARLAVEGAQHLNKEFKNVTNALINAVAGAKILVVKKATFQGSLAETRSNFFILGDLMGHENVTLKMKINLLKPWETDLRALTATMTALIKGEKADLSRESIPAPPQLPISTVSKKEIADAVVAAVRAKARLAAEAKRKEQQAQQAALAAARPLPRTLDWKKFDGTVLRDVAVSANGAIWAIEEAAPNRILQLATANPPTWWDSGGREGKTIDVGPNGNPWLVTNDGQIWHHNGQKWGRRGGGGKDVAVDGNNTPWVTADPKKGDDWAIWRYDGRSWKEMSGNSTRITGGPGRQVMASDKSGAVHYWTGDQWLHAKCCAADVAMGANSNMWVLGTDRLVYGWEKGNWVKKSGAGLAITADAKGQPVVVGTERNLWTSNADIVTAAAAAFNRMQPAEAKRRADELRARQAAATAAQAVSRPLSARLNWKRFDGTVLKDVAVGANGAIWAIENAAPNRILQLASANPPTWWDSGGRQGKAIDVGPNGNPWLVTDDGQIWHHNGSKWLRRGGGGKDVAVDGNNVPWVTAEPKIGNDWAIWRHNGRSWTQMSGNSTRIVGGPGPMVMASDKSGAIHYWTGGKWEHARCCAADIAMAGNGNMWVLGTDRAVYGWENGNWSKKSGAGLAISADGRGQPIVVGTDSNLWTSDASIVTTAAAVFRRMQPEAAKRFQGTPHRTFRNMYIAANNDSRCLDTWPRGGKLGAIPCQAHGNLRFTFWSDGTIRHDPQDRCINVQRGGAHGAPVVVAGCGTHSDQQWQVRWSGGRGPSGVDPTWRFRIVHTPTGRCLTIGSNNETTMTANCVGSDNADTWAASQTWRASKTPQKPKSASRESSSFTRARLVNGLSGQCADESSGKLTRGGKVIMWGCNSSGAPRDRQLWTHNGRGQVLTTNGLCLDVENPNVRLRMPIIIWGCNGSGAPMERQRWRRLADGRMQHIQSGMCLDSTNDGRQRGQLVLYTCSNTPTQKWRVRGTSS